MPQSVRVPFRLPLRPLALGGTALLLIGCAPLASVREIPPASPVAFVVNQDNARLKQARLDLAAAQADGTAPLDAMAESESAALLSLQALGDLSGRRADEAIALYNSAVARLVEATLASGEKPWEHPVRLPGPHGPLWLTLTSCGRAYLPGADHLRAADRMELGGTHFTDRVRIDGVGAPFVSSGAARPEPWSTTQHYYGITAELIASGNQATLEILDPLETTSIELAGKERPVAADLSAPLALGITETRIDTFGLQRLFRTDRFMSTAKLMMLGPYRPNRTPLIFIHGLGDAPVTFAALVNGLSANPDIRRNYQFWVFQYPSGLPFPLSAELLRKELNEVYKKYPATPPATLIGHSMGGLVTDLLVRDSGTQYIHDVLGKPIEKFQLPPDQAKLIQDCLIFHASPQVARAIFIATPHRGAAMASGPLGRFGASLVRLPGDLLMVGPKIISQMNATPGEKLLERFPNSIDTLRPNARVIVALDRLPIDSGVAYYSVIGKEGDGDLLTSSDGIVPYTSAHLDGARDEVVVPYGHSYVQSSPPCIAEIQRILQNSPRN